MLRHLKRWVPSGLRKALAPVRRGVQRYRLPVHILEGVLSAVPGDDADPPRSVPLRVVYMGKHPEHRSWWMSQLFGGSPCTVRQAGTAWAWDALDAARRASPQASLLLVERLQNQDEPWRTPGGSLFVPWWVEAELDVTPQALASRHGAFKSTRRRIRTNRLEHEISRRPEDFEHFYHRMYLPTVLSREGGTAVVAGQELLRASFEQGLILWILQDGKRVAGQLLDCSQKDPMQLCCGVCEGDAQFVSQGVYGAMLWYSAQYACQQGAAALNMGGSRPSLSDGVLRFKAQFGSRLIPPSRIRRRGVQLCVLRPNDPGLLLSMSGLPLIHLHDGAMHAAVVALPGSMGLGRPLDANRLAELHMPGLTSMEVFVQGTEANLPGPCGVVLRSTSDLQVRG